MDIFWNRAESAAGPLTQDDILQTYKFTNVYRVLDRVSQYLLRHVIYRGDAGFTAQDVLLRILVFKIFNKIETWEFIESQLGEPLTTGNFNAERISKMLSVRMTETAIFNSAYIMAGSHQQYVAYGSKHQRWLQMVEREFLGEGLFDKILSAKSLEEIYKRLSEKSFIGRFLAYQYAIDFNYSPVIHFDENSFVKAGIGAIRGIRKCFVEDKRYSFEDYIRHAQENFEAYQEKFGYTAFRNLYGRKPTLIDLQNCFCETDKYLRVRMPALQMGNVRIKQKFKPGAEKIDYFFPPKWGLDQGGAT